MTNLNYGAIALSSLLTLLLGFVWFTLVFRAPYIAGLDRTAEQMARGPSMLVASVYQLLGGFIMAAVLAYLMKITGNQSLPGAAVLAALIWLGFIAAVLGPMYAYQAFSLSFFLITAGFPLAALLMNSVVLSLWR